MMPLSVRRCECSVHIACVKTKIPLARAISCLLYRICNNATNPVLRNRVIMFIRVLRLRIYPPSPLGEWFVAFLIGLFSC